MDRINKERSHTSSGSIESFPMRWRGMEPRMKPRMKPRKNEAQDVKRSLEIDGRRKEGDHNSARYYARYYSTYQAIQIVIGKLLPQFFYHRNFGGIHVYILIELLVDLFIIFRVHGSTRSRAMEHEAMETHPQAVVVQERHTCFDFAPCSHRLAQEVLRLV